MPVLFLFLAAGALGAYGYWRGGMRIGLSLAPLISMAVLFWLFGGIAFRMGLSSDAGIIWPPLVLLLIGLGIGYTAMFFGRRKLPKEKHKADRIAGTVVGVLLSFIIVWVGCLYVTLQGGPRGSSAAMADFLNTWFVQWVPAVGSASDTLSDFSVFATASDPVRERAVENLELEHLQDIPEVQALVNDPETMEDFEAAAAGDWGALFRLQKNPLVLDLMEADEIREVLERISHDDLADAIRQAEEELGTSEDDEDGSEG